MINFAAETILLKQVSMKMKILTMAMMLLFSVTNTMYPGDLNNNGITESITLNRDDQRSIAKGGHRSNSKRPIIYVSGFVISVPDELIGYSMILRSDDEVVYQCVVSSTEQSVPDSLSGNYTISFEYEGICYYGFINF